MTQAIIHFLYESANGKIHSGATPDLQKPERTLDLACMPGQPLPRHATGETSAVTCPNCKKSEVFKRLAAEQAPGSPADKAALAAMAEEQGSADVQSGE